MTAANPSCDSHAFSGSAGRKLRAEPTLEEILAGPIVRAIMVADHVDAQALTAMLRSVALRLRKQTRARRPARPSTPTPERAFGADRLESICPIGLEISAL